METESLTKKVWNEACDGQPTQLKYNRADGELKKGMVRMEEISQR